MKTTIVAGALALAAIGLSPEPSIVFASELGAAGAIAAQETAAVDIVRIKRVLKLTKEQERYWPPVEAALHSLAKRHVEEPGGLVHRISRRVVSIVLDGAAVSRLATAARPLIATLRDDQKQAALDLAQEMGLGPVLAALN
jgi:hypothetical protein